MRTQRVCHNLVRAHFEALEPGNPRMMNNMNNLESRSGETIE